MPYPWDYPPFLVDDWRRMMHHDACSPVPSYLRDVPVDPYGRKLEPMLAPAPVKAFLAPHPLPPIVEPLRVPEPPVRLGEQPMNKPPFVLSSPPWLK